MKKPVALKSKEPQSSAGSTTLAQRLSKLNRWRENYNPLRGLTLSRAVQLAESYFRGEMADLQWAYFFIEQTDADLLALLECRFSRLLEMDYHVKAPDMKVALAEKQVELVHKKFAAIDNLYAAIEHLGMASFRGFGHCEKWYQDGEITHLEIVDQWNAVRDGLVGDWKYNPQAQATTFAALPESARMLPENFLYREVRRPINRIALFKFVRDNLSNKDWDAFVEIFGFLGGVVIGPQNVPADKEAAYEAAALAIAEGGSGYLPYSSDYKVNETAKGAQPFKERLDHLSEKLILAGTGGKLTMLTEAGSGTLAGGAHADVFDQISRGEARLISEVMNKQLVKGWLDEAFPGQPHLAYFELAANEEADIGEIIQEIKGLHEAGFTVDPAQVQEKTGWVVTVTPVAPPAFGFGDKPGATIANRDTPIATGTDAIFKANAAADELAARRPVFRPLAARLAAMAAETDPAAQVRLATRFKADSASLFHAVINAEPDLAGPTAAVIGTALLSGFAEAAAAKAAKPAKTP